MPTLAANPNPTTPDRIDIVGSGFDPALFVALVFDGSGTTIKIPVRRDGSFAVGQYIASTKPDGTYKLEARSFGTATVLANLDIVVKRPSPTGITFQTTIAAGAILKGTVDWQAINLSKPPTHVEFLRDGAIHWNELYEPWGGALDTTKFSNGPHTLQVIVYDAAGSYAGPVVSVTVDNSVVVPPPPPPPPPPATGAKMFGPGIMSDGKDNAEVGRIDNQHWGIRWHSKGGVINGLWVNQRFGPDDPDPGHGYSHGDGGLYRISLQRCKADGMPDGVSIAERQFQPVNPHNTFENKSKIPFNATIPEGDYVWVWDNIHADQVHIWMSLNFLVTPGGKQPGTDVAALIKSNASNGQWRVEGDNTPTFQVTFNDGHVEGQGYSSIVAHTDLGTGPEGFSFPSPRAVRERWTGPALTGVVAVWLRVKRITSAGGSLRADIGGAVGLGSVSGIPVSGSTNLNGSIWVRCPFNSPINIPAGEAIATFTSDATLSLFPIRRDGREADGWGIPALVSRAEKSMNGTSWSDLYNAFCDLQWYLELA